MISKDEVLRHPDEVEKARSYEVIGILYDELKKAGLTVEDEFIKLKIFMNNEFRTTFRSGSINSFILMVFDEHLTSLVLTWAYDYLVVSVYIDSQKTKKIFKGVTIEEIHVEKDIVEIELGDQ